ncbi:hypothetical protein BBP40_004983 [Aspergillus hancockii]|nr:hypothetical protein BBP40_004983 [Aspergillus hancockii]
MLQPQQNGVRAGSAPSGEPPAILTLVPLNGTFEKKQINVPYFPEVLRIGRQTNAKTLPTPANGFFDSKVLSRQHAEVWAEKGGRIFIRDVKSSNGTFVNGTRLSPENRESEPHELRENDQLELGIDIISEDQKTVVHHKSEMKQAKQQSQDLRQTDDFLSNLTKPGHPEKERVKSSPADSTSSRQVNGRPKIPRLDSFSRFSDPPAPPPQQPLPEKPDALPRNGTDATSPLKRADTEKPKLGSTSSPVSRESSQILSLIEALSSAKRELDSQGARVKELESLLLQERTARESAEEKARSLEIRANDNESVATAATSDLDATEKASAEQPSAEEKLENGVSPEPGFDEPVAEDRSVNANSDLQHRLITMMQEMEEMRKQLTVFRDRAEKAENETAETRKSLAEMIETLRQEREERSEARKKPADRAQDAVNFSDTVRSEAENLEVLDSGIQPECAVTSAPSKELENPSTAFATQSRNHDVLEHSSPYASMLGVVLLGVGLMAYLNGWQKMDK